MSELMVPSFILCLVSMAAPGAEDAARRVPIDDPNLVLSPYAWKMSGAGPDARAEATMPGAYVRAVFRGSSAAGLMVDGTANNGCPAPSMPVIEHSVDDGPFTALPLSRSGELYLLPLADKLDPSQPHRLELCFRAADLGQNRWTASTAHLRIAGLELTAGGSLLPCPRRPRRAICFGDSITEGVGAEGLFTSWQSLGVNSARASWCPIVCTALDCEYGQLGSGGQGIVVKTMALPPLPQAWSRYDAATSRLKDGLLLPEPDYVFCAMGTNDYQEESVAAFPSEYLRWLVAVRKACPSAWIFCIVPPLGRHDRKIAEAVQARQRDGDSRVHCIDTAPLRSGFAEGRPTRLAHDGVHPSIHGNALLGALIVAEVEKALSAARHE
jgi:lysophospholipase L1-like esterase